MVYKTTMTTENTLNTSNQELEKLAQPEVFENMGEPSDVFGISEATNDLSSLAEDNIKAGFDIVGDSVQTMKNIGSNIMKMGEPSTLFSPKNLLENTTAITKDVVGFGVNVTKGVTNMATNTIKGGLKAGASILNIGKKAGTGITKNILGLGKDILGSKEKSDEE